MTYDDRVEAIHGRLAATRELPVDREAARWIGEAEAVAGDLVAEELPPGVLAERLSHVEALLANVDGTAHPGADEHVEAAERLTADLLGELDGR